MLPKNQLERSPSADLWRNTLSGIPTLFGRLVYLASLRDQNTGRYEHFGLAQMFGDDASDGTLRASHVEIFQKWLCAGLEEQRESVEEYLQSLESKLHAVIGNWLRLRPYRNLPPVGAREAERQLFLTDLEIVLELLRHANAVASPDPDA